jgi:signal transduction histidine kinase
VIGLLLALVLVAGAVAGVVASQHARDKDAEVIRSDDLAIAVGRFQADVSSTIDDARRVARQVETTGRFVARLATATSPVAAGVGFCAPSASSLTIEGLPLAAATLESAKGTLDVVRDTAEPRVLPNLALAGGGVQTFVVAPAFGNGAIAPSLKTTDQRRADLLGYVMVGIDLPLIATRASPLGSSIAVAPATTSSSAVTASGTASTTLTVGGQAWVVSSSANGGESLTVAEGALLALALAVAAMTWASGIWLYKRRVAAESAAASTASRLRLMTALAPLVQEAVDLGQILPEIATRLRDELDLAGLGFALPTTQGTFRDVYALGSAIAATPSSRLADTLGPGESAAIALDRGGRSVGVLSVRASRRLDADEIDALRGAADLATAAIVSSQLFEQQEAAIRALRSVDELKTAFLSTASHELRTPVAAIKGFASLLDEAWDGGPDADHKLYAERILANANALDVLLQDLLDFSRLERGRRLVSPTLIDITAITEEVMARLSVVFAQHDLATDLRPTPPVLADREGLERILTNLASNAVRYSPPGTTVTVRTAPSAGGAELIVDDEGPGVPAADRDKVFARFFRGSSDEVIRTRGTGIGLAVVKEYVDQLGGAVSVGRAPTGGARFRVWFAATAPAKGNP